MSKSIGTECYKEKKENKSKKKHFDWSCLNPQEIFNLCKRDMLEESDVIRRGRNIPDSLKFDPKSDSAFFFGKENTGQYVGKKANFDGHILVTGGTGSWKTINNARTTIFVWKGTIFLFDFKGDLIYFAKMRNSKILYLIRGHKNRYYFNPFSVFKSKDDEDLAQRAQELSNAIIPLSCNASEPFWIEAARNVLAGALLYFYRLGSSFIEAMIEIKTQPLSELLKKITTDKLAGVLINRDLELNPKTLSGVSMELHNHIAVFATDTLIQEVLSSSDDDYKEQITWEDLENQDVFIRIDQSKVDQWGGVIRLLLIQLIRTLERRPEKYDSESHGIKPTLLLLDEFPQYGKIDILTSSLKTLRSKKVTFALFCQSLADLDETYGKDTRRSILDNCPYKVILRAADAETQQYFSDLVGMVKVPSMGISFQHSVSREPDGYSLNISETMQPIIFPHEFGALDDVILLCPEPERFCRLEKETRYRN